MQVNNMEEISTTGNPQKPQLICEIAHLHKNKNTAVSQQQT